ncbi:MAG: hypothetical protein JWM76_3084 [Pseudonocardiales bacterium]|nr:hypothetical protein [Pseudonocardiales bacterium]
MQLNGIRGPETIAGPDGILDAHCQGDPQFEKHRLLATMPGAERGSNRSSDPAAAGSGTCAVADWARWGALELTGRSESPPTGPGFPLAHRVTGAVLALAEVTSRWGYRVDVDPAWLLSSRAALAGFSRQGQTSANSTGRLLPGMDGSWVAVSLSRAQDIEVVCSLAGTKSGVGSEGGFAAISRLLSKMAPTDLIDTLISLEVPAAIVGSAAGSAPLHIRPLGSAAPAPQSAPVVVDLSAMWAGPLTAHLLGRAGAQITKIEDPSRPDGARRGSPQFFQQLHAGHDHRWVDLRAESGIAQLRRLIEAADVVIESSRPRALEQLGFSAEGFVRSRPGRTWISITGYGRDPVIAKEVASGNGANQVASGNGANQVASGNGAGRVAFGDGANQVASGNGAGRVAFGDDAAAAGGLVSHDATGSPVFCADAIADPLSGLVAAVAASASISAGGGHLIEVALAGVSADFARPSTGARHRHTITGRPGCWRVEHTAGRDLERGEPGC